MPLFGKRKRREPKREPGVAYIPRTATLYGDGPDPVAPSYDDPHPGSQSLYGNPGAPTVGRDFPTMGQIAEDGRRADPRQNPSDTKEYWERRDADDKARHGVEYVVPTGISTAIPTPRLARRWQPAPPPERPTGVSHPELDSFANPSATGGTPREFNGAHFSMASNQREYDILGMQPMRSRRNTYRAEPTPWDTDVIDRPASGDYTPEAVYESPPTPMADLYGGAGSSYRLG